MFKLADVSCTRTLLPQHNWFIHLFDCLVWKSAPEPQNDYTIIYSFLLLIAIHSERIVSILPSTQNHQRKDSIKEYNCFLSLYFSIKFMFFFLFNSSLQFEISNNFTHKKIINNSKQKSQHSFNIYKKMWNIYQEKKKLIIDSFVS